jgi:hypothetical protein
VSKQNEESKTDGEFLSKWFVDLLDRSGLDVSPCKLCEVTVICIPDGLAMCKACAEGVGR